MLTSAGLWLCRLATGGDSKRDQQEACALAPVRDRRYCRQVWDDVHKKSDKGELFTEADGARLGPVGTTNRCAAGASVEQLWPRLVTLLLSHSSC